MAKALNFLRSNFERSDKGDHLSRKSPSVALVLDQDAFSDALKRYVKELDGKNVVRGIYKSKEYARKLLVSQRSPLYPLLLQENRWEQILLY